jgi:hypothetical protein
VEANGRLGPRRAYAVRGGVLGVYTDSERAIRPHGAVLRSPAIARASWSVAKRAGRTRLNDESARACWPAVAPEARGLAGA